MAIDLPALWKSILLFGVVVSVGRFLVNGYLIRSRVNRLRKMGLPMPPWNWFTGHLLFLHTTLSAYPSKIMLGIPIKDIYKEHFSETEMFYLDTWPLVPPTLVVCNPAASEVVNRKMNVKPTEYESIFELQSGGPSLLSMNGRVWKYWRGLLNPGFAPSYVMGRVGDIIDCAETFSKLLLKRSKEGRLFELEDLAVRFTIDTIMRVALNHDLNYQEQDHPVPEAIKKIIHLTHSLGPLAQLNPFRHFQIAKYDRIINTHFTSVLEKLYLDYTADASTRTQSIISLTIPAYLSTHSSRPPPKSPSPSIPPTPPPSFLPQSIPHLRMLLIAGYDTTSTVLIYAYHKLSTHTLALSRLRAEHTQVFGPDPLLAAPLLRSTPSLLNSLPYTTSVLKETMRLFPPAAGPYRTGAPSTTLVDAHGTQYPTAGCLVHLATHALQSNARSFPEPEAFRPERWVGSEEGAGGNGSGMSGGVEKGAFRPFERGPRNCIGQDVAMLQLKVALVLAVRRFVVRAAYEEVERERVEGKGWFGGCFGGAEKEGGKREKRDVHGEKAYQVEDGGTHPALGYPCRVEVVEEEI